jgi:hypothetical protein
LLPESGFCWKRDHQDTIFLKINNYPEIHIISEDEGSQKEEARGAAGWAHH